MKAKVGVVAGGMGLLSYALAGGDVPTAQAADPCDYLPKKAQKLDWVESFSDSLCDVSCASWPAGVSKPSAPVPSGTVPGLSYTEGSHAQCSFPKGLCKQDTVCAPGQDRVQVGGVWKCRKKELKTVDFDPRAACKANVAPPPFKIDKLEINGSGTTAKRGDGCYRSTGRNTFMFKGTNVALAEKISFGVSGVVAVREQASVTCPPPGCVRYSVYMPPATATGSTTAKLHFWGNRKTESASFQIVDSPKPKVCVGGDTNLGSVSAGQTTPGGAAAPAAPNVTTISGRRWCEGGQVKVSATPATFTLSQAQMLSVSNQLVTTGCTSALTGMSSSGSFHLRAQGDDGIGSEIAFTATTIALPAGTWVLNLSEGSTPAGNYSLKY